MFVVVQCTADTFADDCFDELIDGVHYAMAGCVRLEPERVARSVKQRTIQIVTSFLASSHRYLLQKRKRPGAPDPGRSRAPSAER